MCVCWLLPFVWPENILPENRFKLNGGSQLFAWRGGLAKWLVVWLFGWQSVLPQVQLHAIILCSMQIAACFVGAPSKLYFSMCLWHKSKFDTIESRANTNRKLLFVKMQYLKVIDWNLNQINQQQKTHFNSYSKSGKAVGCDPSILRAIKWKWKSWYIIMLVITLVNNKFIYK